MGVLLVDLDDTLIPDVAARDGALTRVCAALGSSVDPPTAWPAVRRIWRESGLYSVPDLAGVSSWEALWTDFDQAAPDPAVQSTGRRYQEQVWQALLPGCDPTMAGRRYRAVREEMVRPFDWVEESLTEWRSTHELWCVTNGSSWLQRRKLDLAGISSHFTQVVPSGEVGADKRTLRYQAEVAQLLAQGGMIPRAVVGDSESSDRALAHALGVPHVSVLTGARPDVTSMSRL